MRKKFKLIREYPESPEIGFVIYERQKNFYSNGNIEIVNPEKYPEFWEECKDEYPKIVSFWDEPYEHVLKVLDFKGESKEYVRFEGYGGYDCKSHVLDNFTIYEVAISEDITFKVGDSFTFKGLFGSGWKKKTTKINGFEFNDKNELCAIYYNGSYNMIAVKKMMKPATYVFKCFDGVNLYEGDTCYAVEKDAWEKGYFTKLVGSFIVDEDVLYFSSPESAGQYIIFANIIDLSIENVKYYAGFDKPKVSDFIKELYKRLDKYLTL